VFEDSKPNALLGGYASIGFDAPFIMKRMLVHGIRPHRLLDSSGLKPWEIRALDLKDTWKGTSFYPDSLSAVAVALGLPSPKINLDGAEVSKAFFEGRIDEIVEYCTGDVLTTANIYRKFVSKPILK
jgi:hypothetical protein